MKKNVEYVRLEKDVYIAEDGKVFDNADECVIYETHLHEQAFNALPSFSISWEDILGDDKFPLESYTAVPVRSKDDMDVINKYLEDRSSGSFLDESFVGSTVYICETDNTSQLMEGFSLEQMKADIADNIDQLIERKARFDSNVFGKG